MFAEAKAPLQALMDVRLGGTRRIKSISIFNALRNGGLDTRIEDMFLGGGMSPGAGDGAVCHARSLDGERRCYLTPAM